jgi:hypothetical protein
MNKKLFLSILFLTLGVTSGFSVRTDDELREYGKWINGIV